MQNNQVELTLEVNGRPVREFEHEKKTYVESRENTEYSLRIKNGTAGRALAVISIDGINAISGQPVTNSPDEMGYVLNAYETQTIKGYRADENTAASFKFVKRGDSYATEKAEGQGNGVIAIRVYREKDNANQKLKDMEKLLKEWQDKPKEKEYVPYPVYPHYPVYPYRPWRPYWERDYWYGDTYYGGYVWGSITAPTLNIGGTCTTSAIGCLNTTASMMNCSMTASNSAMNSLTSSEVTLNAADIFEHGSSWGQAVPDRVKEVAFEVGEFLTELIIYYAPLESLKILGVNVAREKQVAFPEPFKRSYATPPKGWVSGKI